ncbi:hypothetical protein JGS22_011630 [Streptomyces sp. P38-E01]|uniref:Integral membrane protein n=1 Tax=Streptomyces tardus TaxID=2780544 RepID=A0A949N4T2_9ACTN|nr:hypothetical protein [Streptomyces tardus]MBU7598249.1 hypothetical protein [Streptomyces tardus]
MDVRTSPPQQDRRPSQDGPQPEPILFYGTRWVDRTDGYVPRRIGLGLGAFLATLAGAGLYLLAWQGLAFSEAPGWVNSLVIGAVAICTVIAFVKSWNGYVRPTAGRDESVESSMRSLRMIGFVGGLLAYALRSLVEAPGEKLRRTAYDAESRAYERRRVTRTGNPALRAASKARKRR